MEKLLLRADEEIAWHNQEPMNRSDSKSRSWVYILIVALRFCGLTSLVYIVFTAGLLEALAIAWSWAENRLTESPLVGIVLGLLSLAALVKLSRNVMAAVIIYLGMRDV